MPVVQTKPSVAPTPTAPPSTHPTPAREPVESRPIAAPPSASRPDFADVILLGTATCVAAGAVIAILTAIF